MEGPANRRRKVEALRRYRPAILLLFLFTALVAAAAPVHAAMSTGALTDDVLHRFQGAVGRWQGPIQAAALSVFWKLALIMLVVRVGTLVFAGDGGLNTLAAELVRFSLIQGFWVWVLQNGPQFFQTIVRSLWQLGGQAGGLADGLSVSGVLNLGLKLYQLDAGQNSLLAIGNSIQACFMGILAVILAAIMAANIMLVMCGAWVTAYAGAIVLALGAFDGTRDIAANYLRAALSLGLRAMALALIMGLGMAIENDILTQAGTSPAMPDVALLTMALIILCLLALVIPYQVSHLAGVGGGFFGGALGFGAAWMAMRISSRVVNELRGLGSMPSAAQRAQPTLAAIRQAQRAAAATGNNGNGNRPAAQAVPGGSGNGINQGGNSGRTP